MNTIRREPPRRPARTWRALAEDEHAATSLEWALLLAAIALPGYVTVQLALSALTGHYEMMTTINALPFP
ncbi:MAG: hypothetical protein WD294_12935 [Phycisphaeraceae bacterium]